MAYMDRRTYVPNNKDIKEEILREHHNLADIGHPGQHMFKDASSVNRTRCNIKEKQANFTHWRFQKDHGRTSVST